MHVLIIKHLSQNGHKGEGSLERPEIHFADIRYVNFRFCKVLFLGINSTLVSLHIACIEINMYRSIQLIIHALLISFWVISLHLHWLAGQGWKMLQEFHF